jgi:hypothetical protein
LLSPTPSIKQRRNLVSKFLYLLSLAALVIGLLDASGAADGSHRQIEAGILLILFPVFGAAGYFVGRSSTKTCPSCAERVKKAAITCKHCGGAI